MVREECGIITDQPEQRLVLEPMRPPAVLFYGELFTVFKGVSMSEIFEKGELVVIERHRNRVPVVTQPQEHT